jgi:regulator of replication initiation timing
MKRLTPFILAAAMVILLAGLIFEMREVLDAREQLATLKEQNAAAMAEIDALNQDIHASKLANATLGRENRRLQSLVAQSGTLPTEPHHSKEAQPDPPDPQDPLSQMIDPSSKRLCC